jgi:hypothetical protein
MHQVPGDREMKAQSSAPADIRPVATDAAMLRGAIAILAQPAADALFYIPTY